MCIIGKRTKLHDKHFVYWFILYKTHTKVLAARHLYFLKCSQEEFNDCSHARKDHSIPSFKFQVLLCTLYKCRNAMQCSQLAKASRGELTNIFQIKWLQLHNYTFT